MGTNNINEELKLLLADTGFKSSIVSIERLDGVRRRLDEQLQTSQLNGSFYEEIVSRYDLHWNFSPPEDFSAARSIIVVALPQPKVKVEFTISGRAFHAIIPPTYMHDMDAHVLQHLNDYMDGYGYSAREAILQEKLLAVCSGLAVYGKNNIAYIDGWGSYFRAKTYFTDMPADPDDWQELKMMERCEKCSACITMCPTGAIHKDRFLIRAEKCLTYFNEGFEDFPDWIDPSWHHCLIGCMKCQDVCPKNKDFTDWIVDGEIFSEEETQQILRGTSPVDLPPKMVKKLKRMHMLKEIRLLSRNMKVLLDKEETA